MPRIPTREAPLLPMTLPESFTVHLKTMTPMFGGGAQTHQADERHPVRAASVRGHLRFWWRATAGAGYTDKQELYAAESELWGNTEKAGKVRVEVVVVNAGTVTEPVRHEPNRSGKMQAVFTPQKAAYALFPFQGIIGQSNESPTKARQDIEFWVKITCPPALRPQVETALHAWIFYGGIGSRTRRGCGSLELVGGEVKPTRATTKGAKLLTAVPKIYFLGQPQNDAVKAWAEAVKVYADFRQGDGIARTASEGRPRVGGKKPTPGRSFWPEPDSLRRETRRASYGHTPRRPEADGYPRADLGLPIGFQFKHEKEGDPEKLTLQGGTEKHERFASPVITKAVIIEGKFYPMLAILDSPHIYDSPYGVDLVKTQGKRKIIPRIPAEKLALIQKDSPQNNLQIRQALAKFVRDNGKFCEVIP